MAFMKSTARSSTTEHQSPLESAAQQHHLAGTIVIPDSTRIKRILKGNTSPTPEIVPASDRGETTNQEDPSSDGGILPDGGLVGWTQVLMSHLINFNSFGFMLSFGIFQSYYTEALHFTPSNVSWIGTMELFLVYFVGVFSGRLMDAGYYRFTLLTGLLLQVLGVFATSFSTKYWQLFLAQGLCQGLGNGLLFCPAVALVSTYFSAGKRAFAVSLVASGGATGGMVFPAVAEYLLPRIGFPWTVRVMGFIMLFVAAVVLPFSKPRLRSHKRKAWLDLPAFREPPYVLFCVGIFLAFWGLYFAYYYVTPFGRDRLHLSQRASFNMILVINSFGIPGRAVPALLADRFSSPLGVIIPVICLTGILLYCWIAIKSATSFSVWVAAYGFLAGGCQSLFQAACSSFSSDMEKLGVRIGMVFTIVSFACLSGAPLSGGLVEHLGGKYLAAQLFGGTVMVAGSTALLAAWLLQRRINDRAISRTD
jgi:MFS family permease